MKENLMKYLVIALSAFIIEICSTFYIRFVAEANSLGMLFFAAIGPFLGLPFVGYMVESKTWSERLRMALALSLGYVIGCLAVITIINKK
jgi:hypothetical protein